MLRLLFSHILCWSAILSGVSGEDLPLNENLGNELREAIRGADRKDPARYVDLMDRIFASRSLELLALSFENVHLRDNFGERLRKERDPKFYNQAITVLLRASSHVWRDGDNPLIHHFANPPLREFCLNAVGRYVPAVTIAQYDLTHREGRMKLAAVFEQAAGIQSALPEIPADPKRVWPPKTGGSRPPLESGSPSDHIVAGPVPLMSNAPRTAQDSGGWLAWAGVSSVLAAAAGWLFLRARGSRRGA